MSFLSYSKVWIEGPIKRAISLGKLVKSGGAGSVYLIKEMPTKVAKIYHRDLSLAIYERKIKAMLSLTPSLPNIDEAGQCYVQIAWPEAILHDDHGMFIGFIMPMLDIKATSELEYILQERQAKAEGLPVGLGAKITLAANLSGVIAELHRQHHYVVDMKPVNLRFYRQSLYMAMLDCDGFSIQGQGERFEAPQFTPDYLAPEFQVTGIDIAGEEQQDRFALAVVIFQLLNFGIHPFTGRPASDQVPTDIPGRIKTRSYAYGLRPNKTITPTMVSGHNVISKHLRQLFDRAFESTGTTRPSANEWTLALKQYAQKATGNLLVCEKNKEHQYFSGLACAACARENLLQKARQASSKTSFVKSGKPYRSAPITVRQRRGQQPKVQPPQARTRRTKANVKLQVVAQPSQASAGKLNWFLFHAYPVGTILILSFLLFLANSWNISGSQEDEKITFPASSPVLDKNRALEITSRFEPDDIYMSLPEPNLDDTRNNILLAANSIADGDIHTYEKAMAALQLKASKQRGPYTSSIDRYQKALSEYLSSDSNSASFIEEKQAKLQEHFTKILARDPLASEVAIELAWMKVIDQDSANTKRLFEQSIWAEPGRASAWYGLGICMLDGNTDSTVVGMFIAAELLYDETSIDDDSRSRVQSSIYLLSAEKQKRFKILQMRAKQIAEEIPGKSIKGLKKI